MQRVWSAELSHAHHAGQRVLVAGWLHRLRRLSGVSFLILRDARGLSQVVIERDDLLEILVRLQPESVLKVTGLVVRTPQAPGGVEVHAEHIEVVSAAVEPPPFEMHRPHIPAQLPTLLDHAAVALRHPRQRALFQFAAASVDGFRRTLRGEGFVEVFTPKVVASATETGADVFQVDYFGRAAYLAQSPQFYKQMLVGAYERVFEVGPVFRAEPHDTPRHLNEYVSLDAEMGFIGDHLDVMRTVERAVAGMLQSIGLQAASALALLGCDLPPAPDGVPSVHFDAALEMIARATGEDVLGEPDLSPAHERWLGDWAQREHGSEFLFVVGYPMRKRPFYTHPDPDDVEHSNSFDLLFRGLEVVTGGQRLHRYADYLRALQEREMDPGPLAGYLEAFKHGMPPHGGFALGLERWVARLVGAANVRETTMFPRDLSRLTP
jgi:nondiscriminating aspartyl-tRNA synthetase